MFLWTRRAASFASASRSADEPRPLHGDNQARVSSHVEPSGEFALPNLERGRYDMLLRLGAQEIELSGVDL